MPVQIVPLMPAEVAAGVGRLWWVADDMAEAEADRARYLAAGALRVQLDDRDLPRVQMFIDMPIADAAQVLAGYVPDAEEWMDYGG